MKARSERRFKRPTHEGSAICGSGDFPKVSEGIKSHGWHKISRSAPPFDWARLQVNILPDTRIRYVVLVVSLAGRKYVRRCTSF